MKALVLHQFKHPPVLEAVADPICPDDGVVVEVRACGVCRSDHHGWLGFNRAVSLPHVLGHELAGVVVEVGRGVRRFRRGDRVTAPFILGCGTCADCTAGRATICDTQKVIGFSIWGAFAQYVAIDAADFNLVAIPDGIDCAGAAALGCRMTTAYRALVDRAGLKPGETVAIHGCGGVGLSAVMIAKAMGARVVAVDINDAALKLAKNLGADVLIDARDFDSVSDSGGDFGVDSVSDSGGDSGGDSGRNVGGNSVSDSVSNSVRNSGRNVGVNSVGAAVREATGGGADVSVDALGISQSFHNSLQGLRKLGRHIQIGLPVGSHAHVTLPLFDLIYSRQLQISGTRGLAAHGFPPLLEMISDGVLDTTALISAEITLHDVAGALQDMNGFTNAGVKVVTEFGG